MVDPISLTGLALGGLAAGGAAAAMSGGSGGGAAPTPAKPPAQPVQAQAPATSKPMGKSQTPTFLGAAATPPTQSGQKTLLGQ